MIFYFVEGGKLPAHFLGWGRVVVVAVAVVFLFLLLVIEVVVVVVFFLLLLLLFIGSTPEVFFNFSGYV